MTGNLLTERTYSFNYKVYGSGAEVLLCFHGYGQNAAVYKPLSAEMGAGYKIISITLPAHPPVEADIPFTKLPISAEELCRSVDQILSTENVDKVHLAAYSLGGRLALVYFQHRQQRVKSITLMASDGFKKVPFRKLATGSIVGNRLFRMTVYRPGLYFFIVRLARILKFIPRSTWRFAMMHTRTRVKREQLYAVWMCLRNLHPNLGAVSRQINRDQIPIQFISGKYDHIIPRQSVQRFCNRTPTAKVHLISEGHNLLRVRNAAMISKLLVNQMSGL